MKTLSQVKDDVAQKHGYSDWCQIDMTDRESREKEEIKASMLDEVAIAYASQPSEGLTRETGEKMLEALKKAEKVILDLSELANYPKEMGVGTCIDSIAVAISSAERELKKGGKE